MIKINIEKLANKNLTKNLIADYKPFTMVDGEGIRCALYVSGCPLACKGCYNKSIQNFSVGIPYTQELEDKIIEDLSHDYVQGLTLLGGEPFMNPTVSLRLIRRVRDEFGNSKDIWCWTGFTWEEIHESLISGGLAGQMRKQMLEEIDVLVDGRYIEEQEGWSSGKIKFRGSWNQRIISVKESKENNEVILLEHYMNQE